MALTASPLGILGQEARGEQHPHPGPHPDPPPQRLRQRQAPMALPPALSISARVQWGVPAFPGSLFGPAQHPRPGKPDGQPSPRGPGALKPPPAVPSSSRPGVEAGPGLADGGAPCAAHTPSREAGSRPGERVLLELNSRKSLHLHKESWQMCTGGPATGPGPLGRLGPGHRTGSQGTRGGLVGQGSAR